MKKQAIELEELGSKIYNNVQAIVYAADMDTYELVYINAYTQEVIGAEPGKKCYQAIHNKDTPCELCPNKRLIDREGNPKKAYLWEYYNHHTGKWYEATVQALILDNNRKIRYEIANDITHRKRDEKSLMQIIKNQRLLTEISYIFNKVDEFESKVTRALEIILNKISLSGAFIFEVPKTEDSNYFSVEAPNNRINTHDIIQNTTKDTLKTFIQNLVSKGYITNNMPDIIPRDVLSRLNNHNIHKFAFLPIMIEMDVYGILCLYQFVLNENWKDFEIDLFRTISSIYSLNYKRKINEEEIIQSERELRQVNATKDKFFKIIAHDLKNPFTSILGYSELILRKINKIDPAKLEQFITIISTTSKSAHNLLENLLLWARSQDGSIMHNPEKLELYNIIHETELLLSS